MIFLVLITLYFHIPETLSRLFLNTLIWTGFFPDRGICRWHVCLVSWLSTSVSLANISLNTPSICCEWKHAVDYCRNINVAANKTLHILHPKHSWIKNASCKQICFNGINGICNGRHSEKLNTKKYMRSVCKRRWQEVCRMKQEIFIL